MDQCRFVMRIKAPKKAFVSKAISETCAYSLPHSTTMLSCPTIAWAQLAPHTIAPMMAGTHRMHANWDPVAWVGAPHAQLGNARPMAHKNKNATPQPRLVAQSAQEVPIPPCQKPAFHSHALNNAQCAEPDADNATMVGDTCCLVQVRPLLGHVSYSVTEAKGQRGNPGEDQPAAHVEVRPAGGACRTVRPAGGRAQPGAPQPQ